jgi:hypothetical protein
MRPLADCPARGGRRRARRPSRPRAFYPGTQAPTSSKHIGAAPSSNHGTHSSPGGQFGLPSSQNAEQQPGSKQLASAAPQKNPGSHALANEHPSPCWPTSPDASITHENEAPPWMHTSPGAHETGLSGSHTGRHSTSTSWLLIVHAVLTTSQIGCSIEQVHSAMQVPWLFSSAFQHIAPFSHESIPLTPLPSTVHTSPTLSGPAGTHFVAFQLPPPSSAHALHFSPSAQSCANRSHSAPLPASGAQMKSHDVESPSVVVPDVPVDAANGSSSPACFGSCSCSPLVGRFVSGATPLHDPGGGTSITHSSPVVEPVSPGPVSSVIVPTDVAGLVDVVTVGPVVDVDDDVGSLAGVSPSGPAVVPGTLELLSVPVVVAIVAVVSLSGPHATAHSNETRVNGEKRR